jgi:uncharacterized coiled-coil DUF342 family protein
MGDLIARKIDSETVEFDKEITVTYPKVTFKRDYLEKQRKDIIAQRDEFVAQREKEIAEIDTYLAKMDELGVVSKEAKIEVVEPVVEPKVEG